MKSKLIANFLNHISNEINELNIEISSLRDSQANETKSSAGDKFETSREMMRQEIDKLNLQILQKKKMQNDIKLIDSNKKFTEVEFGVIVKLKTGFYFVSVPYGNYKLDNKSFFFISAGSPIGQKMLRLKNGEKFELNGKEFEILELI